MDKRVLRERMRRKKRQMMIRHYTKIGLCVIGMILAVVFVVRGIIIPIAHHVAGGGSSDQTVQAQADTEEVQANSDAAVRQPLKGKSDTDKVAAMTAGWHEDANGKWYQNTDGTYFSNGFQDIDGVTYSFDENGYIRSGEGCTTNVPGIFAAGDCRTKSFRQLTTAVSDGTVAALAACEYIDGIFDRA